MLTAQTKNGKSFCLAYRYKKETLIALRKKEEFFCPICGEKVLLKLGDSKIYHFAHQKGSSCREIYENESECHLQGKLQLFEWLKRQKISAVLEYYDSRIGQRPDILFLYQGRKYALEYQCSSISETIFQRRTKNYLLHGFTPLWIIGCTDLEKMNHYASITNFQYFFLKKAKNDQLYIPIYSPNQKTLLLLTSIYPYSTKDALVQKSYLPLEKVQLPSLLEPARFRLLNMNQWKVAMEGFISKCLLYSDGKLRKLLTTIYERRLNLFLLPPEIGLPVHRGLLIQTPPLIWQLYYFLDILWGKSPGDLIRLHDLKISFEHRIRTREIQIRRLPQINPLNPFMAIMDYTYLLTQLGVLKLKTAEIFQLQRNLKIPQTNREKENMTAVFAQQNTKILMK